MRDRRAPVAPGRCPAAASCHRVRRISRKRPRCAGPACAGTPVASRFSSAPVGAVDGSATTSWRVRSARAAGAARPAAAPAAAQRPGTRPSRVRAQAQSTSTARDASQPWRTVAHVLAERRPFEQPAMRSERCARSCASIASALKQASCGRHASASPAWAHCVAADCSGCREVLPQRNLARLPHQLQEGVEQWRHAARCRARRSVHASAEGSVDPARQQQQQQRDRHQAAPQVVGDFPARQRGQRIAVRLVPRRPAREATASSRSASRRGSSGAGARCRPAYVGG